MEKSLHGSQEAEEVYTLLENYSNGKKVKLDKILVFTDKVLYLKGEENECASVLQEELFVQPLKPHNNQFDGFIVGIPSDSSGAYNKNYCVVSIIRKGKIIKASWITQKEYYSFDEKKIVPDNSRMFTNIFYDKPTNTFISHSLGNAMGHCSTSEHFVFNNNGFELVKVTRTDDCDKSPQEISSYGKDITAYQKYVAKNPVKNTTN